MSWLNPALRQPSALAGLENQWRTHPNLRICDFLEASRAQELLASLRDRPLTLYTTSPGSFRYQYWADAIHLEREADPVLASFARWLYDEGMSWLSSWTKMSLSPPPDRQFLTTLYGQGSYLDPHNDADGHRSIAFVIGMTTEKWDPSEGGSLEFLESRAANVEVSESRTPGFNTVDFFSVHDQTFIHQVRLLQTQRQRRAFAGWFHLPR